MDSGTKYFRYISNQIKNLNKIILICDIANENIKDKICLEKTDFASKIKLPSDTTTEAFYFHQVNLSFISNFLVFKYILQINFKLSSNSNHT